MANTNEERGKSCKESLTHMKAETRKQSNFIFILFSFVTDQIGRSSIITPATDGNKLIYRNTMKEGKHVPKTLRQNTF